MEQSTNPAASVVGTSQISTQNNHSTIQNILSTLREPRNIVQSLTTKFQATADVAAMARIDQSFEKIMNYRQENLSKSNENLKQWLKKVECAKWEAQRPSDKSQDAHADRMAFLEKERFSLAKSIDEIELSLQHEETSRNQLRSTLIQLKEKISLLDQESSRNQNVIGGKGPMLRETRVKSMVFREMGLSWLLEDESSNANNDIKCRVISRKSNDVHTLSLSPPITPPSDQRRFDEAQKLWSLVSQ